MIKQPFQRFLGCQSSFLRINRSEGCERGKPLKRFYVSVRALITGLKPGVNERGNSSTFKACWRAPIRRQNFDSFTVAWSPWHQPSLQEFALVGLGLHRRQ